MAMIESGFHLNVVILRTIISEWCSDGGVDRAIEVFEKMCEHGVSPKAWRATRLTKEAKRILSKIRNKEMTNEMKAEEEIPVESLERLYHKEATSASYSNLLQIPNVVSSDKKEAASRAGRYVQSARKFMYNGVPELRSYAKSAS
ncbi:hypothetical protein WN943_018780 [Citrus x changshan-huyou]